MPARRHHTVIIGVGFGFAGLAATNELSDAATDVTVVDARGHSTFQPRLARVAPVAVQQVRSAASWLRFSGPPGWFALLLLHLVMVVGVRNRADVLFSWAWNYITQYRASRIISEAPSMPRSSDCGRGSGPLNGLV